MSRKRDGSGLGLAICKGITEGLSGKIWIESKENMGSTFYFEIPKQPVKATKKK
jgi:signal transduction histidine kinase